VEKALRNTQGRVMITPETVLIGSFKVLIFKGDRWRRRYVIRKDAS
jgi:hypothetical protein